MNLCRSENAKSKKNLGTLSGSTSNMVHRELGEHRKPCLGHDKSEWIRTALQNTVTLIVTLLPAALLYACYIAETDRVFRIHDECTQNCIKDVLISKTQKQLQKFRVLEVAIDHYQNICMSHCAVELESNRYASGHIKYVALGVWVWCILCVSIALTARGATT